MTDTLNRGTPREVRSQASLVRLEPSVYRAAQDKAAATGTTVAGMMRALLKAWLDTPTSPLIAPPEDKPAT
jgi:hypothetical protein